MMNQNWFDLFCIRFNEKELIKKNDISNFSAPILEIVNLELLNLIKINLEL